MKRFISTAILGLSLLCFNACDSSMTEKDSVDQANDSNATVRESHEDQPTASTTATVSEKDSKFMVETADGSMLEIEASKLAQQVSTDAKVKQFAEMMVTDHEKASKELMDLAAQKQVKLPTTMGQENMDKLNSLREKKGKEFDDRYIELMKEDHDKTVSKFEEASKSADDADLKAWAAKTLPTLKMHKEHGDAMKNGGKKHM